MEIGVLTNTGGSEANRRRQPHRARVRGILGDHVQVGGPSPGTPLGSVISKDDKAKDPLPDPQRMWAEAARRPQASPHMLFSLGNTPLWGAELP